MPPCRPRSAYTGTPAADSASMSRCIGADRHLQPVGEFGRGDPAPGLQEQQDGQQPV